MLRVLQYIGVPKLVINTVLHLLLYVTINMFKYFQLEAIQALHSSPTWHHGFCGSFSFGLYGK